MKSSSWVWASAKATGTSHVRSGRGCDDFGGCAVVQRPDAETLIVAVSDGAGSAENSAVGSRLTTMRFVRSATEFVRLGTPLNSIGHQTALGWLDEIRDEISNAATKTELTPRQYAATLVACIVGPTEATFIQVGDGAAVFRLDGTNEWQVAIWPAHGEYASTTYFVTDDPQPTVTVSHLQGPVGELAVFTDGLERLLLDFNNQTAFAPFFERIFGSFGDTHATGRDKRLSQQLRSLLESRSVCEKTDDDKTIFLAKRN